MALQRMTLNLVTWRLTAWTLIRQRKRKGTMRKLRISVGAGCTKSQAIVLAESTGGYSSR